MTSLNHNERQAVQIGLDIRQRLNRWLADRGVKGSVIVTPFIDPVGRPTVLIRINAYVARALVMSLEEQAAVARSQDSRYNSSPRPPSAGEGSQAGQ